jgi:hypothetical protein
VPACCDDADVGGNRRTVPVTTSSPAQVTVRQLEAVRARLRDQSLAWARDRQSGKLRYIMELGEHERGAACGCACISCNQPLLAVNAAKADWDRRPHFRHESGTEAHSCQVLSARAALLGSLQEGDLIVLPRLRRSITIHGFSGAEYEGWTELPPQPVRVGQLRFSDTTTAEVVLDDGRRLTVVVVGSASLEAVGGRGGETIVPRIEICIDDPVLARLSPEELKARLVPALEEGSWCGHWPDSAGDAAARDEALRAAGSALDWSADDQDVPPELRGESLLHREVKAILARATSVLLPSWHMSRDGRLVTDSANSSRAQLAGARLEQKLGRIIPDVVAELRDGSELLVEVTVTNTITPERLERIRAVNLPTVEIDFSHMAGALSRATLRHLVLDQVTGKVWLHHPAAGVKPQAVEPALGPGILEFGPAIPGDVQARKEYLRAVPLEAWAKRYLEAVEELARIDHVVVLFSDEEREAAYAAVVAAADGLHLHGFPEALDYRLFDHQRTMLHRLMAIMLGRPVAYRYSRVWQVINSMLTDVSAEARSWHALYLLAIEERKEQLNLTSKQRDLLDEWRARVRVSLRSNEDDYRRDPLYDRLFEVLFPELSFGLENLRLKRAASPAAAAPAEQEPDLLDAFYFDERGYEWWTWARPVRALIHEWEIAGSRARLDGWAVDDTSILYHLVREKFSTRYVSTLATAVGDKIGAGPAPVLRFLYRCGHITLKD